MIFSITDTGFAGQKHKPQKNARVSVTKKTNHKAQAKKHARTVVSKAKGRTQKQFAGQKNKAKLKKTKLTKIKKPNSKKTFAKHKKSKTRLAKGRPTKTKLSHSKQTKTQQLPKLAYVTQKLEALDPQKISDTSHPLLKLAVGPPSVKNVQSSPFLQSVRRDLPFVSALNEAIRTDGANALVGVYIKSMKYGDVLYGRNIHQPLTPASTLKVLTAEAALIYLGPLYRFSTQLLTDAKQVKDGVLQGNVYIVLGGDPTLTFNDLLDLLSALSNEQIRAIAGNVYIDNTAYDQNFYGPNWAMEDKSYCYGAPISASIINRNCIFFKITSSSSGHLAQIVTSSRYFYPAIKNGVVTKREGTRACSVRLSAGSDSRVDIDGCIPVGRALGVSYVVSDVPEYTRALFSSLLNRFNIKVYGSITFGQAKETLFLLGSHASKPLRLLINDMLKKSDNIIAGAIFKKLGQLYMHRPGSWETGGQAVTQILSRHAGMNAKGARILDGSGLSPSNLTTPAQMMSVLNYAYHHAETSEEFISALPIAGVDGTLKHRMTNIPRKVRAKTGTITGVVGLAGFAVSADKEPLAFVILINGNKGLSWRYKEMEDKIALILTRFKRK
jgi:D-alanyl-D-alanine carboxypeptidase/D-alanyl-D-alanine-endopeptidase (penicillin-binding protein 4)